MSETETRNDSDEAADEDVVHDDVAANEAGAADDAPVDPLAEAIAERDANYDRLLRAQAEHDNYRKRVQKERDEDRLYHAAAFARALLPALDNLQRAIDAAGSSENVEDLAKGVEMVATQFTDILAGFSIEPITAVGEAFDPNLHEAIQQIPSDDQPKMTVLQEVERGYKLHDRVVRPSKVIVSSGPPDGGSEQ